jgi:hypothetical protein
VGSTVDSKVSSEIMWDGMMEWNELCFSDEHKEEKQVESLTTYFALSSTINSDGSRGVQVIKQKAQV